MIMKNSEFRIQKVIMLFVLSFYLLHSTFYIPPIHAQEPATQSSSLLQKIDSIKTEIASKAAALKNEVSQKMSDKALLGQIKFIDTINKTSAKITIQTKSNSSQVVLINEYTVIEGPGLKPNTKKILSLKDLTDSDMIIGLGDIDDKNNLNAKKIVKLEKYVPDSKVTVWGNVEAIDGANIRVKKKDGSLINLQTSKNTLYKVGGDDADVSEVTINRTIIAVGLEKPDQKLETRFIYMSGSLDPVKKEKMKILSPAPKATDRGKKVKLM